MFKLLSKKVLFGGILTTSILGTAITASAKKDKEKKDKKNKEQKCCDKKCEPKQPVKVLVSGAGGNIGYSLLPMIANGDVFGKDQPVDLILYDLPTSEKRLEGVVMELQDSCYTLLNTCKISFKNEEAFNGVQYAFLLGGLPRGPGMERRDLLLKNANIFVEQGKAIDKYADKNIKVLIVANPANTNALVCMKSAPSIPKTNFTSLTRLDYNRTRDMIANDLAKKLMLPTVDKLNINNITIWGNHSSTQFPDISFATYKGRPIPELLDNNKYYRDEFIKIVQQRGAAVIAKRGISSGFSAAKAAVDHMHDWSIGTREGSSVSMGIISDNNPYGVVDDLIFSFPVTCVKGECEIVRGILLDEFQKFMIKATESELLEEKRQIFGQNDTKIAAPATESGNVKKSTTN